MTQHLFSIATAMRQISLLLLVIATPVWAEDTIKLSGFGTLGLSCFSNREVDYIYNTVPRGPGRTQECDAGLDSNLGVQADTTLTSGLDAVVQVISQRSAYNNFKPEFSLANLRFQASQSLILRVGRVSNPMFLDSDYRLVHFSLPVARPQTEVYGLSPTYTMDGIDAIYRADFADWKMDYFAGFQNGAFAAPRDNSNIVDSAKIDGVLSLGVSAAQGPWFYKAGYSQARVTYVVDSIDALLNGLRSIDSSSPGAAALADQLDMRDATYHLYTLGGRYDKENWLVQAEFAERIFDKSFFRDSYGAYIMAGYRINAWMPYVSIGKRQSWGASSDARAGVLATKVTGLLNSTRYGQKSITLGTSYELGKSTTLKGQVLWLQPDSGAYGNSYGNASSGYNSDQPPVDRLVTVNVNFIF